MTIDNTSPVNECFDNRFEPVVRSKNPAINTQVEYTAPLIIAPIAIDVPSSVNEAL